MIEVDELGLKFDLPEKITVEQQMRFWTGWHQSDETGDWVVIKRWELINKLGLIAKWECDYYPDPKVSLDKVEDARVADVVINVVGEVYRRMTGLKRIEKK